MEREIGKRRARAGGIKAGLILIFKFCGETTSGSVRVGRGGEGEEERDEEKRDRRCDEDETRKGEERQKEESDEKERTAAHNRFSNS